MKDSHITVDGRRLFTRFHAAPNSADKPTAVFLHEGLGSTRQWKDFPEKLAEIMGFGILSYDRSGHGLSDHQTRGRDKDYLDYEALTILPAVLEHFQIRNPVLWGHSDGGSIALLFASRFPARALILEAAHVFVEPETLGGIRAAVERKDFLIERLRPFHGDKTDALWSAWVDTWLDESFADWNIETSLPDIECPALVIQGENDAYGTKEQVIRIARGIGRKAEVLMIPGCAHRPHHEAREIVLENSVRFLNKYV